MNQYDELNAILDAGGAEFGFTGVSIERWRWDEPSIAMSWTQDGHHLVSKNVRVSVQGEPSRYEIAVELNA